MTLQMATTILAMIQGMLPNITTNATVQYIINTIAAILPVLMQAYSQLVPQVQQIIALIQQRDDITDDQVKQLQAISAAIDAHFEATLAAARAQDAAFALSKMVPATA